MGEEKYDLVFRGELVPGADLAQVKQNLSRLFKMDASRIEVLFTGKPVVLKRGLDMDTAGKYRVAIKKAGARIDTVASRVPATQTASKAKASTPDPRAHQGQDRAPAPQTPPNQAVEAPVNRQSAASPVPPASGMADGSTAAAASAAGSLQLAPTGGDLLEPAEKRSTPAAQVDTSGLQLRPVGEALLDDNEREEPVPLSVNLQGLDLAPAGTDVLKPEERQTHPPVHLDLSQFSLAPPGDRLAAPRPAPPPPPDVSKLSLVKSP